MGTSALSIDVYVAPMRPYISPDHLGEGEVATWAPSSSTLISGPTEGILIDALLTFENADQIAAWAKRFGKKSISPRLAGTRLRRLQVAPLGRRTSTIRASIGRRASRANSPIRPWCRRC